MENLKQELTTPGKKNVTFKIEGRAEGEAYESQTNKDSKLGLVLIQEWWGLNVSITKTTDQFAAEGFRVICPDIYRGKCAKNREEAGHLIGGLDWQGAVADIIGNVKYLKSTGCTKVGVLGFCMGGALTIAALTACPEIDAGSPFYGVPDLKMWDVSKIKCPIFSIFAENDKAVGFSDLETAKKFEQECLSKGVNISQKIWKDAEHAFMNPDGPYYNKEVAAQALKEVSQFFKQTFTS